MSTDLRDPEMRDALDRAVRHLDPDPEARLGNVLRRGGQRRSLRLGALGAAVALFVAGVGWGAIEIQRQRQATPLDSATWQTYRDRQLGWSMASPPGWHLQTFDEGGHGTFRGVLVANVEFDFRHPDLRDTWTGAWDMRGLPTDAVVVQFQYLLPRFEPSGQPDTPFPLSLDDARPVRDRPAYGAPQPRLFLPVIAEGEPGYAVFAWFGSEASPNDRAIAERIVASITFASSRPPASVVVPNVMGLPEGEAVKMLAEVGLLAEVRYQREAVRTGEVLDSDPPSGSEVVAGSNVRLRVAYERPLPVPDASEEQFLNEQLAPLGRLVERNRQAFVGLFRDHSAGTWGTLVVVFNPGTDEDAWRERLDAAAGDLRYRIESCTRSREELEQIQDELALRTWSPKARSIGFAAFVDPATCTVRVESDQLTAEDIQALSDRFGTAVSLNTSEGASPRLLGTDD
jgi:PASTA domain-containing protein